MLGTQPRPGQQLSPVEPPPKIPPGVGAWHTRPDSAQMQRPPTQLGAFGVQMLPHPPQFIESFMMSTHVPAQHAWPSLHCIPPQVHTPPVQVSPGAQARPISPQ
ncbi:MAG TPA: hypothetical protein VIL25_02810 [Vicinamibacterales bacterium]